MNDTVEQWLKSFHPSSRGRREWCSGFELEEFGLKASRREFFMDWVQALE